jgi:two-component system response regulator NreC
MAIRIVIADDHRILRAGLKTLLCSDPGLEVIGEATNGDEAIQKAQELHPDIVLLDIGMPGMNTLDTTRCLVQNLPDTRVLMLTMHEDSAMVQEYLRAGASGYIVKRAAESELIDAIYAVWRGMIYVHPALMRSLISLPEKPVQKATTDVDTLTSREIDLAIYCERAYEPPDR